MIYQLTELYTSHRKLFLSYILPDVVSRLTSVIALDYHPDELLAIFLRILFTITCLVVPGAFTILLHIMFP